MKITKPYPSVTTALSAGVQTLIRAESVADAESFVVTVKNTGSNPLTGFLIKMGLDGDIGLVNVKSTDFQTFGDPICYYASADPSSLAAGGLALLKIDASEVDRIEVYATSANGTSVQNDASGYSYVS